MALFQKCLDNPHDVSQKDWRSRENLLSANSTTSYSSSIMVATSTTSRVSGASGSISISALSSIQAQELDTRVIAVAADEPVPKREVEMNNVYGQREQDRKVRREIANSNERRRMQSINAGFKSLKTILPHADGDKLSKAAILQQTAEYIFQLESDKLKLLNQNEKLRRACAECSSPKHKAFLNEGPDKDEGIGSPREEDFEELRRDTIEVRQQLDKERRLRMLLEDKVRGLEAQLYPEKLREIANSVVVKYKQNPVQRESLAAVSETLNLAPLVSAHEQEVETCRRDAQCNSFSTPLAQQAINPAPAQSLPHGSLCVTIAQSFDNASQTQMRNPVDQKQRSRQPLKKRAVELASIEPQSKIAKIGISSSAFDSNSEHSNIAVTSGIILPQATAITQSPTILRTCPVTYSGSTPFATIPYPAGSVIASIPQDQLRHVSTVPTLPDVQRGLVSAAPPTYLALAPAPSLDPRIAPGTPVAGSGDLHIAVTPAHVPATNPLLRLPSTSVESQYKVVPPISMTLTQLNAVPSVACTHSTQASAAPSTPPVIGARTHGHLLPVVAMDTVFVGRSERRISSATTDSAVSDEDSKSESLEDSAQPEAMTCHAKSIPAMAGEPLSQLNRATIISTDPAAHEIAIQSAVPPVSTATLSLLTRGPGSPPIIRRIDTAATRRNLETIVQAIDHLEQQERRNSQDQQNVAEEVTLS